MDVVQKVQDAQFWGAPPLSLPPSWKKRDSQRGYERVKGTGSHNPALPLPAQGHHIKGDTHKASVPMTKHVSQ